MHIYQIYIYDLSTDFIDNILKWAWALFCSHLIGFKYHYITVTIYHQSFVCSIWPIEPNQMLPIWMRVNLGAMAIKGYSTLPRSSDCLMSYLGHSLGLALMQRFSWCILQPKSSGRKSVYKWIYIYIYMYIYNQNGYNQVLCVTRFFLFKSL